MFDKSFAFLIKLYYFKRKDSRRIFMKKTVVWVIAMLMAFPALAKVSFEAQIPVEVEAENSVKAKDKAMQEAQRQGFLEVAGRLLTVPENIENLKSLSDDEILHFIQAVSVADEKAGGTKYKAVLTVQINEPLLKDYLAENNMIDAETTSLLVIPVYKEMPRTAPQLWENTNAWRTSWRSKGLIKFGTMEVQTADARFQDIENLSAENALYMDSTLYNTISERFGSDRVYVIYAETQENGDLKVTVKNEKNKSENSFSVYNDSEGNLFDKAVEKSVMFISNMEREAENSSGTVANGTLNAVYEYGNIKDWLAKSTAITALPQVDNIDTKSLGGGKVSFTINYNGSLDDLLNAFQELGLSYENNDNYYILR